MTGNLQKKGKTVLLSLWVAFFFLPSFAYAAIPPLRDFGGLAIFTIPCTCSAATWDWFAPLFLAAVPVTGPVTYVPYATVPFANYTPELPGIGYLGAYMPGIPACWQYLGVTCVLMPSVGAMAFVGTGL